MKKVWIFSTCVIFSTTSLFAQEDILKRVLNSDCTLKDYSVYEELESPQNVKNFSEMFSKGIFYGRLRLNSFAFDWKDEIADKREDHQVAGLGGSFVYKSANLHNFAAAAGLYTSFNPISNGNENVATYKAGKGTISRYDASKTGKKSIMALAQAYIEYVDRGMTLQVGRFLFESFLTKSNDTKMIPNSFEGFNLSSTMMFDTKIKLAYLSKQKLRDHSSFHHVLAYGDNPADDYAQYTQNDDSAMHRGLTMSKLKANGIEDKLFVAEVLHTPMENLFLTGNYTAVPDLISSAMLEAKYEYYLREFLIIPSVRYMRQYDQGAGKIGGANLVKNTVGYKNIDSLDSSLFATKIDIRNDIWKLRVGYSKVADRGDIVAPWRGFPTGGFTRAMGQYNWYANTKTYMVRLDYDFEEAGLIPEVKAYMRYAIQDFDDSKAGVQADSNILTLDILKFFESMPNLYLKMRMAYVNGESKNLAQDGTVKKDPSYNELRFEMNYLF
ncbi:MAG: OprD family outer membrane porin [Sulfurovaceae bacterium]|nr:OprD family outer membrane porin [Sulfurovaceae bacterium]